MFIAKFFGYILRRYITNLCYPSVFLSLLEEREKLMQRTTSEFFSFNHRIEENRSKKKLSEWYRTAFRSWKKPTIFTSL